MPSVSQEILLTYDDVLLRPRWSDIMPKGASLKSRFSRNIPLNIPLVSAAMDTVTEAATAIVMAQQGGIGVIHKNMNPSRQAEEVAKVKKYESGIIINPITVGPKTSLGEVIELTRIHRVTGVPVVDERMVCVGIITGRDMQFQQDMAKKVEEVMTPREALITSKEGVSLEEAKRLLHAHRIEKLPIIDEKGTLKGLITIKDILRGIDFPASNKDGHGRLRVAAAVGVGKEERERAAELALAGVDALVVDTAHGHSKSVREMLLALKDSFPEIDIVAGNVATAEGAADLIKAKADGIKVGIGPGSICTTRVVAGVGVPQMSAVLECVAPCRDASVPLIADGGIKYSGDVVKALAGGASSVMIGSQFAGTDEAPGETVLYQGRSYKVYRGMGSLPSLPLGGKERYAQGGEEDSSKFIPEGIEGQVPARGPLVDNIYQIVGGVRAGMGYIGAKDILALQERAEFVRISSASLLEGHPHGVMITKEAPNYSLRR